ncbi:transposase [Photobacterium leiognathi]|uniref:transposase n=1 Tax=Photobacterium leiognathi TaxID=553611 RepID=UPI001EDFF80C|nr:transposase [Photobacterium leiognathi]
MADNIWGKLYGDKGYINKTLTGELLDKDMELITTVRKSMKKKFISLWNKVMLKKRFYNRDGKRPVEQHIVYRTLRHRSMHVFISNLLGRLVATAYKKKKLT